jgi:hypothetical protein
MAKAENVRRTIPEKRNRKVKVTQSRLQQIILEEYIKEEALEEALSPQQEKEMLAWIRKQGPKPDWLGDNYGHSKKVKSGQVPADPNADRAAQTMPIGMDIPSDDAPERDYSGFQDRSGPSDSPLAEPEDMSDEDVLASISQMIQGRDPETVQALFQAAFEQIPGIEMGMADDEEEELGTPYGGKEFDRRKGQFGQAGFREQLVNEVYARILESDFHRGYGMAGIPWKRDIPDEEVDEGLDDYPDFEPAYDVMKGEGPPEEAPFHDMSDVEVPYARELAQKMWDGGERLPDTSQTAQLSAKQEASLIDTIEKESGDLHVDNDALSDLVMDVTEELWAIQEKSEDV